METSPELVVIRPAREQDAEAYRDLRLEALRNHPEAFGSDFEQQAAFSLAYWQERLRANIDNPRGIIQFAVSDQALIGMAGLYRNESPKECHAGTIWGVYVRPHWRGQGIAQSLVDACMAWGKSQGVWLGKLAVVTTNIAAIRCYLDCGFTVYGVDPAVIFSGGTYHDEFLTVRRLRDINSETAPPDLHVDLS